MPPRTRTRATKDSKENADIGKKIKIKSDGKINKTPRKALADKTNSLSDDNASIDIPIKSSKIKAAKPIFKEGVRPRRERRLPTRYVENQVLNNLSNNKETPVKNQSSDVSIAEKSLTKLPKVNEAREYLSNTSEKEVTENRRKRRCRLQSAKGPATEKPETPSKQNIITSSPFKTPSQILDSSLIANRPKRICRLPSKFEDHSISPNKFISVQPCQASTPIVQNKVTTQINAKSHDVNKKSNAVMDKASLRDKMSPDTNNNPKGRKVLAKRVVSTKSPLKQVSPKANSNTNFGKRLLAKNLSFRVFEDRKKKSQNKDEDVYEFTYDPNDEPTPQKKKRKKPVKRRPPKPKTVVLKNNYDKNVEKALEALRNKVKPAVSKTQPTIQSQNAHPQNIPTDNPAKVQIIEDIIIKPAADNKSLNHTPPLPVNESAKSIHMSNYASIHVEDIAADFESMDNGINYSPVNSPCRPETPEIQDPIPCPQNIEQVNGNHHTMHMKDPLNLQGESFYDEQPVASSSMNVSVRDALASPWRVEFGNLPIRWQANTYVKANMTPAVESSFINSEEISKKKHVYTNMIAEEPLPQIEDPPNLKQTSIISFMREVAERSLKKKRGRSVTPVKENSLFVDISTSSFEFKTPKKARKENVVSTPNTSINNDKSCDNENLNENHVNSNNDKEISNENNHPEEEINQTEKSPKKKQKRKDKDVTFFGFDESESYDQENVSPIKNIRHTRARVLKSKSRTVLREINAMSGPTRAVLPAAKSKLSNKVVETIYDQLKSAEAPQLPENAKVAMYESGFNEPSLSDDDDSQSVHLFEDIEVVHRLKTQRKSYGKAKKVTFHQKTNSGSDTQLPDPRSSDDDDIDDLTFQMPNIKEKKVTKKKTKKKQLSKKEEKEVEEWAAGFNSMCEDIDEFPLVVE